MTLDRPRRWPLGALLAAGLGLLALAVGASLAWGSWGGAGEPGSYGATVVWALRWPRTLTGLAVGAALGAAGCLMQGLTRNPLADPSVLGVNSGAAFALVAALGLGIHDPTGLFVLALVGAAGAAALVWALGGGPASGGSPVQLALAGVVLTALLGSWTSALLLQNHQSLDTVRTWLSGSLGGRSLEDLGALAPWVGLGLAGALALAPSLDVVALGSDTARALGLPLARVRTLTLGVVVWLSAGAVALAGPIAFLGLAVPHLARALAGPDQGRILAVGLVLGPLLLISADVVGRIVLPPNEVPVGVVTAVLGAPLLIALARKARR